ncbi:MAG: chorismate mutase [unclassified Hahellaceae]|nr:chorismate mutase [Hahellaceae bacterium]|tara:strand:- start:4893 stop:5852 length:960 start_codon:yes stop_codon:yes gene_type:complete
MAVSLPGLDSLRQQIDAVDLQLLALINQRAALAAQVAAVKSSTLDEQAPGPVSFYRPEREAQVLRNIMKQNSGPLPDADVARLFREIMSACLALEKPLRVEALGYPGSLAHLAALKHFGQSIVPGQRADAASLFADVESGRIDYAVLPFGSLLAGLDLSLTASAEAITENYVSLFLQYNVQICGEVKILTTRADEPERQAEVGKARNAGKSQRFIVIGRGAVPASGDDRSSVITGIADRPGGLYHLLAPFDAMGISILRLEAKQGAGQIQEPGEAAGEQFFVIDFPGHFSEDRVKRLCDALKKLTSTFKFIGSYPNGVL